MDALGSITLIVKAPNQKIEDRRVACDRNWTVGQLKEHLTTVYPEHPRKEQQKLVYYGKLLKDDSCLHEVLTQGSYEDCHTVHLVCPQHSSNHQQLPKSNQLQPTATANINLSRADASLGSQSPPSYGMAWASQQQLTAQQRLIMQAYQQQYALFYSQLQQAMVSSQYQALTHIPSASHPPGNPADIQNNENIVQPQHPGVVENDNNNDGDQMNAQGGIDAAVGHQDWLDHVYLVVRCGMMLLLLYYYTTIGRFITVVAFGLFFYLAQGNIRIQRRRVVPDHQQPEQQPEQNMAENQNNENQERNPEERSSPSHTNPRNSRPQSAENKITFIIKYVARFIGSFVLSMIPQNPAENNVN